jgi:hypothetical protein
VRRHLALPLLAACGGAPSDDGAVDTDAATPDCATGSDHVVVVTQLLFSRTEDGVSDGFDLDSAVTAAGDTTGCGVADDVAPDGTPGIDNAFARLLPALELTEASAAEAIIQDAVNTGQLLIVARASGVDDLGTDGCVGLEVLQAEGTPQVGAPGFLVTGQTFDRDAASPSVVLDHLAIDDGVLEAGPFALHLPVGILNAQLDIEVLDARIRMAFDDQGGFTGVLAGGIDVAKLLADVQGQGVSPEVLAVVEPLLGGLVDLEPGDDGACTRLSVTLKVQGVQAFLFEPGADTGSR